VAAGAEGCASSNSAVGVVASSALAGEEGEEGEEGRKGGEGSKSGESCLSGPAKWSLNHAKPPASLPRNSIFLILKQGDSLSGSRLLSLASPADKCTSGVRSRRWRSVCSRSSWRRCDCSMLVAEGAGCAWRALVKPVKAKAETTLNLAEKVQKIVLVSVDEVLRVTNIFLCIGVNQLSPEIFTKALCLAFRECNFSEIEKNVNPYFVQIMILKKYFEIFVFYFLH
jgi:hypothetical protein